MAEKILVPDIGDAENVDVIEVFVKPGDTIAVDDPLITLEGDKATMDVPSSKSGVIESVDVSVGDKVSQGSLIATIKAEKSDSSDSSDSSEPEASTDEKPQQDVLEDGASVDTKDSTDKKTQDSKTSQEDQQVDIEEDVGDVHAGPGVRRIAHEFDIPLVRIKGTGAKGRVLKTDVQSYVKARLAVAEQGGSGMTIAPAPKVDFNKFGSTETVDLNKIKKLTAANMHRNWVTIPHVTQYDEADITEMEAFRQEQKTIAAQQGIRLTPLVFIMKALVAAMHEFPQFNASLAPSGEQLILKQYFNIGVAVDTPQGLVVPVIRDVDKKGIYELAKELGDMSTKAREKGLGMSDMQGGCFTISSLGGIGGTAFTPIINAPEVAILGVSKSARKPIIQPSGDIVPRLMLPLSLSYDHRVIDGAEAARFIVFLSSRLADIRNILL